MAAQEPLIACLVGTRPEAIKMAPVIAELARRNELRPFVIASGQHPEMVKSTLSSFGLSADLTLQVLEEQGQTLANLTANLLKELDLALRELAPAYVVAQGDTSTVFAASLVSFYQGIKFAHVEAGLRTGDFGNPFPEEFNRVATGRLATLHFAPTRIARDNLRVPERAVHVTGNTVIDALKIMSKRVVSDKKIGDRSRVILLTCHRRENFGQPLKDIFAAVKAIRDRFDDVEFVFPVHPNPNVRYAASTFLANEHRIQLIAPANYEGLVALMMRSHLVLTDSGGIQEEAPALGKPVLVLRETTERPEAVEAGVAKVIGTTREVIVDEVSELLTNTAAYNAMAIGVSPYGDGHAASRIADLLAAEFDS